MSGATSLPSQLRQTLGGPQFRAAITLFCSTLLLVAWRSFGSTEFFIAWWMPRLRLHGNAYPWAALYSFAAAFVLLAVVPAAIVKLVFRQSLAEYGVRWGIGSRTLRAIAVGAPVFILGGWIASLDPAVRAYYPINKAAAASPLMFAWHSVAYLGFYVGWEFHFRGFVQNGLREASGGVIAVMVQSAVSTIAHVGRPTGELFAALPAAMYWGWLVFRSESVLAGLAQHFLLGLSLDWFLCYR